MEPMGNLKNPKELPSLSRSAGSCAGFCPAPRLRPERLLLCNHIRIQVYRVQFKELKNSKWLSGTFEYSSTKPSQSFNTY